MKTLLRLSCMLAFLAVTGTQMTAQSSQVLNLGGTADEDALTFIEFEETDLDLGTIKAGEVAKVTYTFRNAGEEPLLVDNVKPSCKCATLTWTDTYVEPGEKGEVFAEIDTVDKEGEQVKYFMVFYNGNPPMERLKVTFVVAPAGDKPDEGDGL